MTQIAYTRLNVIGLNEALFNQQLQAFAIRQRLGKVSHFRHVADEIERQMLTNQFHAFLREGY